MWTGADLLRAHNNLPVHLPFRKNTNNRDKNAFRMGSSSLRACPLSHLWTLRSSHSQQPSHCNQSFSERRYRLSSYFKASLLLSAVCFAHKPSSGADGEVRKRPLAAQTDGDSFMNPDWYTPINYEAPGIESNLLSLWSNWSITVKRLVIKLGVWFLCDFSTTTLSSNVHVINLT